MHIVIIPGFTGYPEEKTFQDLGGTLSSKGHKVTKIAWPHIPDEMDKYSFTATIEQARKLLKDIKNDELILLGFSMGVSSTPFLKLAF